MIAAYSSILDKRSDQWLSDIALRQDEVELWRWGR
jgi:hypothetical protein